MKARAKARSSRDRAEAPEVRVEIGDARLASAMKASISGAVRVAQASITPLDFPVVRLRTHARLAVVASQVGGALAVVRVTASNARRLGALVDGAFAAGAAGVQLVWNGEEPAPARAEPFIFAVLEAARSTPARAPVILSPSIEPELALRCLATRRLEKQAGKGAPVR